MAYEKLSRCTVAAVAAVLLLLPIDGRAQEPRQDHTCTIDFAGSFASPAGEDGHNFNRGLGIQTGGGFAISRPAEPGHGNDYFITANFMYEKFSATAAALAAAKGGVNSTQLANATSAHGNFSAVTLDPTIRHPFNRRFSLYALGGFGWFRRGVGFNGANPANLIHSNGATLDRLAANSGVFDVGGGANFGLSKNGGVMLFAEVRMYRGLAVNSGTTLVPLSFGARW